MYIDACNGTVELICFRPILTFSILLKRDKVGFVRIINNNCSRSNHLCKPSLFKLYPAHFYVEEIQIHTLSNNGYYSPCIHLTGIHKS